MVCWKRRLYFEGSESILITFFKMTDCFIQTLNGQHIIYPDVRRFINIKKVIKRLPVSSRQNLNPHKAKSKLKGWKIWELF